MTEEIRDRMERFRIKAEIFLKNDTKVFLVDINDTYYWADLILVTEDTVTVMSFDGEHKGIKKTLLWVDVVKFEAYKGRGA